MDDKSLNKGQVIECYMNKVMDVALNARCYMEYEGAIGMHVGSGVLLVGEGKYSPGIFLSVRLGCFGDILIFLTGEDAEKLILAMQEVFKDIVEMKRREQAYRRIQSGDLTGYYTMIMEILLGERDVIGKVLVKRHLDDYSLVEVYDKEGKRLWSWMVWGQFWRYFDDEVKAHLEEAGVQVVLDVPEVNDG